MKRLILILAVVLAVMVVFCSASFTKDLVKVRLNMGHPPWFFYADYLAGIEQGYFAAEGINLELVPSNGSSEAVMLVALGTDQFVSTAAAPIIIGKAKGMPLLVVASISNAGYSGGLFFPKKAGIKTPADLKGKKIAYVPKTADQPALLAFLRKQKLEGQVTLVSVPMDNQLRVFLKGDVDAYAGLLSSEKSKLDKTEMKGKWECFLFKDYGVMLPAPVIAVNEKFAKQNPGIVRGFIRAALKSFKYGMENETYAARILVQTYPELDEGIELGRLIQTHKFAQFSLVPGYSDVDQWNEIIKMFLDTGFIQKGFSASELVTNEFIPKEK